MEILSGIPANGTEKINIYKAAVHLYMNVNQVIKFYGKGDLQIYQLNI